MHKLYKTFKKNSFITYSYKPFRVVKTEIILAQNFRLEPCLLLEQASSLHVSLVRGLWKHWNFLNNNFYFL